MNPRVVITETPPPADGGGPPAAACGEGRGRRRSGRWLALGVIALSLHPPCAAAPAAPLDLGRNLAYVRLHRLPEDLPALAAAWSRPALVVDLRYPAGDAATGFDDALPVRPGPAPLFVLVGPATPVDALASLRARAPALITLGLAAPGLAPDIAPPVKPEDDRRAYDALETGASVDSLVNDETAGKRFDEAALVAEKDRDPGDGDEDGPLGPPRGGRTPSPPLATATAAQGAAPAAAAPAGPKDVVLQRAVHLHRALLALGKLPPG